MTERDINDFIEMATTCRVTNPVGSFYPTLITIFVFTIFTFGINWVKSKLKNLVKVIDIFSLLSKARRATNSRVRNERPSGNNG